MRMVLQRVLNAHVEIDQESVCSINEGIVALVGIHQTDTEDVLDGMLEKLLHLRIFEDAQGKMNLSLVERAGGLILVPNFTIYGDARKGRRPSFAGGASPMEAKGIFERLVQKAQEKYTDVGCGVFQADMKVHLVNDGPVTILLDSDKLF